MSKENKYRPSGPLETCRFVEGRLDEVNEHYQPILSTPGILCTMLGEIAEQLAGIRVALEELVEGEGKP